MPSCFHAYDIRGDAEKEVTPHLARTLGRGLAEVSGLKKIAIGHDARLSGTSLVNALASGFTENGGSALNLGLSCTEEIYWAAQTLDIDGAIMVTASHNPANDNGFKIVRKNAIPVSRESGLKDLGDYVDKESGKSSTNEPRSFPVASTARTFRNGYIDWLLGYAGTGKKKPLKIAADCGNGCAGLLLTELAPKLPYEMVLVNARPDGSFPLGAPNPLLPENRAGAARAVLENQADLGIAFDGDADRCFFYDNQGNFIEGYYIVGLLAKALLASHPGEKILHDPRLYWNTVNQVQKAGGIAIKGLTGHAFMKERMRAENAIYGGEMSSHHYFRDFGYCDSGMIPFLLIARLLAESDLTIHDMLVQAIRDFPCSGEINRSVANPDKLLESAKNRYLPQATNSNFADGLDLEFSDWRFSLRKSNTEPLLRLNVESRGNWELMQKKTAEILALLDT